jgi:glycosyltransferase involved in cell wall biosynthesis
MAQLRLAIVTSRFWPLVGDRPTHLLRLGESLMKLGHQVVIVTPQWKRSWPLQMMLGTVPIVRLRGSGRSGWSMLRWMYSLAGWLRDQSLDGAIVDGLRHEAYVTLGAARHRPLPVALIAADHDLSWQKEARFGSRIAERCRKAPAVIAAGDALAAALLDSGFQAPSIKRIARGSLELPPRNPALRDAARTALATVNADLVVTAKTTVALAVGRLDEEHQFGDLVRAWRIITAQRPDVRLWIVGDGPLRERLYRQIGDLDQRFRVLIPGTFDCLEELLQASDMLLVPSSFQTPPMVLLDARSVGLPTVVAHSPMAETLVKNGETGVGYPVGDVKALAAEILKLVEHPAVGIELGAKARFESETASTLVQEAQTYVEIMNRLATEH